MMRVVDLDVRTILKAKGNPFKLISQTVDGLKEDQLLQLHTPFAPTPLYRVLGRRGFTHATIQLKRTHFVTQFYSAALGENWFFVDEGDTDLSRAVRDACEKFAGGDPSLFIAPLPM